MAELTVDRLSEEDVPQVAAIWNPVIRDTAITFTTEEKTAAGLREWLRADLPRIALRDGPVLAGFAAAGPFRSGPGYRRTWEHTIFLAEDRRGRGEGALLVDALVASARAAGVHSLIGGVSGENEAAIRFHLRHGFRECGRVRQAGWKFGRWLDLVLLQRIL